MAYSTYLTYFLWLCFGWFGLHHFYLGRDRHAFVWLWTFGGGFGLGWLTEVVHLSRYIRTAIMDEKYASGSIPYPDTDTRRIRVRRPPFGIRRFVGEMFFGYWIGTLLMAAVPEDLGDTYRHILSSFVGPMGAALGIHTVANIGEEQCDLALCLFFSYFAIPFLLVLPPDYAIGTLSRAILFTAIAINYNPRSDEDEEEKEVKKLSLSFVRRAWSMRGRRYRRSRPVKRHLCLRLGVLVLCTGLLLACMGTALYFNAYVTTDYGERVLLRVAIDNLIHSPAWIQFRDTMGLLFNRLWYGGATEFFQQMVTAFDPEGELHSYKVLNLTVGASEKDINDRYRKLAKQFHPDRFPGAGSEEKRKIEDRFIEIQRAYERVSQIKSKRMMKNRRTEL